MENNLDQTSVNFNVEEKSYKIDKSYILNSAVDGFLKDILTEFPNQTEFKLKKINKRYFKHMIECYKYNSITLDTVNPIWDTCYEYMPFYLKKVKRTIQDYMEYFCQLSNCDTSQYKYMHLFLSKDAFYIRLYNKFGVREDECILCIGSEGCEYGYIDYSCTYEYRLLDYPKLDTILDLASKLYGFKRNKELEMDYNLSKSS